MIHASTPDDQDEGRPTTVTYTPAEQGDLGVSCIWHDQSDISTSRFKRAINSGKRLVRRELRP